MAFPEGVGCHSLGEVHQKPHTTFLFALGTSNYHWIWWVIGQNSLYCSLHMLLNISPLWFCLKLATIWVTHKIGQNIVFQYIIPCFKSPHRATEDHACV